MAVQALIQNDTDAPLVTPGIILLSCNNLGSHVLAGTNHAHGRRPVSTPVAPVEKRLSVVDPSLFVLLHPRLDVVGPLHRGLQTVGFSFILLVALNIDVELVEKTIAMVVVVCRVVRPVPIKRKSKVTDLEMTRRRDEKVVRFDVSVNALECVCCFNTQDHLSYVESGHRLVKRVFSDEQAEKVASRHIVHHQIQI